MKNNKINLHVTGLYPVALNIGRRLADATRSIHFKKSSGQFLSLTIGLFFLLGWTLPGLSQTSTYYSGSGTYTVPPGVTQLTISAVGGAGGAGGQDCGNGCGYNYGVYGQYASTTVSVSPGSTLNYYVGANGANGASSAAGWGGGSGGWGYYYGGRGGNAGPNGTSGGGGGGGGASAVTSGGSLLIVAGGGGGGGGRCNTANSGTGGYTNTGGGGYGTGSNGADSGGDGAGGGGGGGGYVGGQGGGHYGLNGEWAAYGGYSGSSSPSGSYSGTSPYVKIAYTAVGGTAYANGSSATSICSGTSATISLSGYAGYISWYYSNDGSNYYYYGSSSSSFNTGNLTSNRYFKAYVDGVWSSVAAVYIYAPTSAPSSASCTSTTASNASLSWGAGSGQGTLTYYWVVGTSSSISYPNGSVAGRYGATLNTTVTATGLNANTTYYMRVYTSATCGNSGYTTSAAFTTVPIAPVANAQTNVRANSFTANWSASTSGATGYYLDVSTSPDFASYVSGYQNKNVGNVTSFSLTGLNRDRTYYYRVRAYNSGGSSVNSNTISFKTLPLNNFLIEKVGGGNIETQLAGQAFNVRITARDEFNTVVTDYNSNAAITSNSTLTSGATTSPFISGILTSHSVTLTQSGANKTLTASKVDGATSLSSTSTTFIVTPAALDHFSLAVDGQVTAGTAFTVTATAYDVYNNIKTNYGGASNVLNYIGLNNVTWSTTALSAPNGTPRIIPANGNQTFTNGVCSGITGFTFYNSDQTQLAPNVSPTITISDVATAKIGTTAPIAVLNAPLDNFKVVAGIVQYAGVPFTVTVTARDIYLNTCVDYEGSIRFKSSDDNLVAFPSGLQSFAPATTNRGVKTYSNQISINQIGAYWLRAADATYAYKSGEQQNIVVHPGTFEKSASVSNITIDSSNKIAGEEVVVTLTPRDAQGNLLYACQDITVLLDGAVKTGTQQVSHGTENGLEGVYVFRVPVTSTTAANIISATFTDPTTSVVTPFDQTYDINVSPAPPSLAHTIIVPDAGGMTTDGSQAVTVQLKDEFDNLRTTNDGEVTLTTNLGGFGGNNGSQTVTAVYNGTTTGSYSATLYASYSADNHGVGTAAITGSIAFNATPGPGVWSGAAWPANGSITDAASVAISEGLPNLATSTFATDKTTMSTDGTATITVQLKDHLGNLIQNNRGTVTLASDRGVLTNLGYLNTGKYTATLTAGTTPVNGVGLATISGTFIGTGTASSVSGNFNDNVSPTDNTSVTVDITEGAPAVATIDISTASNQITADDQTAGGKTIVTVQLKDALGNLIVNNQGTVTLSTNLGIIDNGITTGASDITANYTENGKYTAILRMNAIGVGNATITGKYNAVAISDNASVTVINGVATQLAIATQPAQVNQAVAGISFNAQPVIHIKDHYGNLVVTGTGSTDVVTATRVTSGTASLQGTISKAAVAGVVIFTDLSYQVAETINIEFASGSLASTTSNAISVVHNVPNYLVITGNATQTAGIAQTITIRAYDAYNNLANRFAGTKTLTFSGANQSPVTSSYPTVNGTTFGTGTAITFASGEATASMNLYKEETVDIAANFTNGSYVDPAGYTSPTGVNINATSTKRLHVVVSQAVPAYLAVTGSGTQVAGEPQTITITAYDSFNNPATGYTGEKTIRFSGANASLVPSTNPQVGGVDMGSDKVLTFVNGVATASMVLYKVENVSIMATDQAASGITTPAGYKLAVTVSHAPASYYAVTGTGTQTAGASQNITVTAYDAFNNQATSYSGDVAVTFSGANPSPNTPAAATNPTVQDKNGVATDFGMPTTITFAGGTATRGMSLYKVETAHIVATAGSITTPVITDYNYWLEVAVNHAANSFFAVTGNSTQTAGESQTITVTMYDAYNNIATGYSGSKSLTFTGANPSPNTPSAATNPTANGTALGSSTSLNFVNGVVTTALNLYKVETVAITVTNGTQTADSYKLPVAVSHADQNFMKITGSANQTAGVSQNITITVYDAYNNVATRFDGSKTLTFSGANVAAEYSPTPSTNPVVSGTAFGSPTTLTFASGVVTTTMNLFKVETALVTAANTDGSVSISADAHKLSVNVSHAAPAYLAVTGNSTQVAGASQTITLTAYDSYNNIATSYSGSKSLTFSGANDAATSPVTHPTVGGTAFGTPKSLTFASGVATGTMTLYKTEPALISATDGTINANSSSSYDHRLSVLVTPTLLKDFLVYDVPDPNDLGTWQPVTVEARDTYNNRKTNYVGKITFSNTDINADNPLDYQFLLSDAGIHIFDNTSGNRGVKFSQVGFDWWLTAVDLAEPSKYGFQSGITVQRAVTITANDRTKTYGDVLAMGTTEFTIADIVSGLTPINHGITGVTLTSSGSIATATVSGSPYTITPSAATGTYTAGLYRIVYSTAGKLTVNKRDLTLNNFLANNKTYDGTTDVTGAGFSDDRVNSDVLTFSYDVAFADKHAGTGKTVNYSNIVTGGAGAGNYTLVTTSGTTSANIDARPITVAAVSDTKVYDGSVSSSAAVTVPALQTGDILTSPGVQAFTTASAGTGKTLTPSGTTIDDGNNGANYAITYQTVSTGVISKRELTVVLAGNPTKGYDGNTSATLTSENYTITNVVGGESVTISETAGAYNSKNAGSGPDRTVTASLTDVDYVAGNGTSLANYILPASATGVGTITARTLTLSSFVANNKMYDGTIAASGAAFSDNRVANDLLTFTFDAAFDDKHAANSKNVNFTNISISGGADQNNYVLAATTGTATANISQRTINVTAQTDTKVYDGNNTSTVLPVVGALQTDDAVTSAGIQTFDNQNYGTDKVLTPSGTVISDGNNGDNYAINYVTNSSGVITKRDLTVTVDANQKKTYGEANPAAYTYSIASGTLATGDEFTGVLSRDAGENAGAYTVNKNTLSILETSSSSNMESNYNFAFVNTNKFVIEKRPVTLTALNQTKTYGNGPEWGNLHANHWTLGNTAFAVSSTGNGIGMVSGESIIGVGLTSSGETKLADTGTYSIAITPGNETGAGGFALSNYNVSYVPAILTVEKRTLHLSNFAADNKTYDGTTLATGLGFDDDRIAGDNLSFQRVALFDDAAVGTNKVVIYSSVIISGGTDKDNYALESSTSHWKTSANRVISAASVIIQVAASNKVYDGNANASVNLSGNFISGDDVSLTYANAQFSDALAANGKTVTVTGIALAGAKASQYSIASNTATATANITKKQLTVTGITAQNKAYDGTTLATLIGTPALQGGVNSDPIVLGGSATASFATASAGNGITVNVLGYSVSGTGVDNYTLVQPTLSANITSTNATITWSNPANISYGTLLSATQLNASANIPGTFVYSPAVGTLLSAGNHNLSVTFNPTDNVNYSQTTSTVSITVEKASLSVTANNVSKVYDGIPFSGGNGVVYSGFVNNENESVLSGSLTYSGTSQGATVKALYVITAGGLSSSNYNITFIDGILSIGKQLLTVTANNATKTYDGLGYTGGNGVVYSGFVNGEDETVLSGSLTYSGTSQNAIGAGNYTITPGGLTSSTYNIVFVNGTLTVNQKQIHVDNAVTQNKEYDRTNSAVISGAVLRASDIVNSDVLTLQNSTSGTFSQTGAGIGISVNTNMSLAGVAANNYSLVSPTGLSANILAKPITISGSFSVNNKIYDGTTTAEITDESLSLQGVITGDVVAINPIAQFINSTVGNGKTVNLTSSTLTGVNAGNYVLSFTDAPVTTAGIAQKELTVSGVFTALNKVYDASTNASINNVTLTLNGTIPGDDVALTAIAAFANKTVGNAKVVSLTNSTLAGTKAANYSLSFTGAPTSTADITKKTLTVSGSFVVADKVYNKTTTASVTTNSLTLVGVETGDVVNLSPVVAFADANKGDGKTVNMIGSSSLNGTDAANYSLLLIGAPTALANITAKPLTLTGTFTADNKVYDRTTQATISSNSLSLVGIETGDVVSLSAGALFADVNKGDLKVVNLTGSTLTGISAGNYTVSFTGAPTANANITAKGLTVSGAVAQDKTFDGTTVAVVSGATLQGVISGDVVSLENLTVGTFAQSALGNDVAVVTAMTLGGANAGNYTLIQPTGLKANILAIGQSITLSKGWNILSFNVLPVNSDLKTIFQTLINSGELIKIMNQSGSTIENIGSWINDIGNSVSTEGYKVKVSQNTILQVNGASVALPLTINLSEGWNLISYPAQNSQNAQAAVQSLINSGKLIKVMDEAGNTIENISGTWFNEIGNFIPGEGYKVKVNAACNLVIEEGPKSAFITKTKYPSTHFETVYTGNGFDHMNVYITNLANSGIRMGDEVAVYDGSLCVGAVQVNQDHIWTGIVGIPVSANDELTQSVNGYTKGHTLSLKLYANGEERMLQYKTTGTSTNLFDPGTSTFLIVVGNSVTGLIDKTAVEFKCYPNPFEDELTIELTQAAGNKVHAEVIDVMGRKIIDLYEGISTGYDLIKWNGTNGRGMKVAPGIYYVRCNGQVSKGIVKK